MLRLLIPAVLFLVFSNGANDNFKEFTAVLGAETLSYRFALSLVTLAEWADGMVRPISVADRDWLTAAALLANFQQ